MSHKNKKSLVRQVQEAYDSMLAIWHSKHKDKINGVMIGDIGNVKQLMSMVGWKRKSIQ